MFVWLERWTARWVEQGLRVPLDTPLGGSLHFFLYDTLKIVLLLALMIFCVSYLRSWFQPQTTKAVLERMRGGRAHLAAALLGIVTPFCSCSSVPIFIGFVEAGIPLGVTFSFLITSPLVNEAAFAVLVASFGWRVALAYAGAGVLIGVASGMLIGRMNPERYLEPAVRTLAAYDRLRPEMTQRERIVYAAGQTGGIIRRVWLYLLIGIAVGSAVHGWVPADFLVHYAGRGNPWGVMLAVLCGIPLYSSALGSIPVAEALIGKGVGLGTALAFMMAVTALSVPEMILLRKVMKPQLLAIFIGTAALGILLGGYAFNIFF